MQKHPNTLYALFHDYNPSTEEEKDLFLTFLLDSVLIARDKFYDLKGELFIQMVEVKEYPGEIEKELINMEKQFVHDHPDCLDFPEYGDMDEQIDKSKILLKFWEKRVAIVESYINYGEDVLLKKQLEEKE